MRNIWRKFSLMLMAYLEGILCYNGRYDSMIITPSGIMTPWGFFTLLSMMNIMIVFIIEVIITVGISKLLDKDIKPLFNTIIGFLLSNVDQKKCGVLTKEPLSEYEKYLYFKYAEKIVRFTGKKCKDAPIEELSNLRDKAYENYLILRLSGVE